MARSDDYTFADMRKALVVGWGDVGATTADLWREYNRKFFGNRLRPIPMFFTPATPYGKMFGWTCCADVITHIALARPGSGSYLVADRNTLLHEMIHQHLHERDESPKHKDQPWCDEVMRLHRELTGKKVWAGRYTVFKEPASRPGGIRKSVRGNMPNPETGEESIGQTVIAGWPRSMGIQLGEL